MWIIVTLIVLSIVISGGILLLQTPPFGKNPSGERLERIKNSPNFKNGRFQNKIPTPIIPEGYSMVGEVFRTFLMKNPRKTPTAPLPSVKTSLKNLPKTENILVWFGHSSYFMQIDGTTFLVDPVFSGSASPLPFGVKSFEGTDIYSAEDFPTIDYLLISHDHYDHLDYKTVKQLKDKVKTVICGLGVGEHFEHWGYSPEKIVEMDWDETLIFNEKLKIHSTVARHGSGRGLKSDNTLWLSFVIETPSLKIFAGGDSGYVSHFKEIGEKFQGFDIAILDNGQYSYDWHTIHMPPKYAIQAYKDLKAKRLFPVHSGKFVLARHPWDLPLEEIYTLASQENIPLITPIIGEAVDLLHAEQKFSTWWRNID